MSEFNITIDGGTSKRLLTAGKYCDRDIVVTATGGGGGGSSDLARQIFEERTFSDSSTTEVPADGFRGWQAIKHIDMPNVTEIGQYACYNCIGLEEIDFPNCTSIGNYAFYNSTKVTSVNLPKLTIMGANSLRQLTAITYVTLPACNYIASTAFQKCTALTKADFPIAEEIAGNAFNTCSALTTLILRNSTVCTLANVNALTSTPIASGTGYIYVPSALVNSYKTATNWKTYANQFRAIEDYPDICG